MRTFGVAVILLAAGSAHAEGDPVDVLGEAAVRSAAGDHLGAIERYEQAYRTSGDVELLTILGSEYHDAGEPGDAIQNLCAYLAVEPAGANAAFAAAQVRAIQAELGKQIPGDRDVCLPVAAVDLTLSPPALSPPALTPPSLTPPSTPVPTEVVAPQGWSSRELAGAATAALGLASIAAGGYFAVQAGSVSDQITGHSPGTPWPDNIRDLQARGERDRNNELLLFATGSVALVTASVLYVTGRRERLADRIAVAPAIAYGAAGLAISGGF